MRELKNHPGYFLQDEAAKQLDKFEDDHGVISINRATVSKAEQQEAINRWDRGGAANRPPYLYEPKRPAEASTHVQGIAVDTSHITLMLKYGDAYGFYQRYSWDKPHFEFDPARVTIRATTKKEDEPMIVNVIGKAGVRDGGAYYISGDVATHLGPAIKGVTGLDAGQSEQLFKRVRIQ